MTYGVVLGNRNDTNLEKSRTTFGVKCLPPFRYRRYPGPRVADKGSRIELGVGKFNRYRTVLGFGRRWGTGRGRNNNFCLIRWNACGLIRRDTRGRGGGLSRFRGDVQKALCRKTAAVSDRGRKGQKRHKLDKSVARPEWR